ncbi:hypothetical protein [Paramagnetospirillum magneticum]|uniref:hypothetical protein n=1 Tax=Paramagnetospirillum magneticum TaxID=84159 RepID=UPI001E4C201F|nr:hypothetical protein [Paramagnetospirillum magneticum]
MCSNCCGVISVPRPERNAEPTTERPSILSTTSRLAWATSTSERTCGPPWDGTVSITWGRLARITS